jgi:ferric-dicitrate binding protein FerR (iron transport regulator)
MLDSEKIEYMIHQYLEGSISEEDSLRLNELVKKNPNIAGKLAKMSFDHIQMGELFTTRMRAPASPEARSTTAWSSRRILAVACAAAAVIVVAVSALLFLSEPERTPSQRDVKAVQSPGEKAVENEDMASRSGPETSGPLPETPAEREVVAEGTTEPEEEKSTIPSEAENSEAIAWLGESTGEVKVRRAGSDDWQEAEVLFCLLPGDSIATGPEGTARIDFESGDYAYINSDAKMTLSQEEKETVLGLEKGEVYLEKESEKKAFAVDTGFGRASSRRGRFHMRRLSRREYLLHVIEGEVECVERGTNSRRRYGGRMRALMQQGEGFEKGTEFDSEDYFEWAHIMRRRRAVYGSGKGPGPMGPGGPMRPGPGPGRPAPGLHRPDGLPVPEDSLPEGIIRKFDRDGDGKLSEEERKALREAMKSRREEGKGKDKERRPRPEQERPGGRQGPGQGPRKPGPACNGRR